MGARLPLENAMPDLESSKKAIGYAHNYAGGKGGAGVFQKIINLMPPHDVYIETHFGGGNIFYRKKLAPANIVIDVDAAVTSKIAMQPGLTVVNGDASDYLKNYDFIGNELIYCDPPYMLETRTKKKIYKYEYTDRQHEDLLTTLLAIRYPVKIMVSGYRSPLYDAMLATFNRIDFKAMTRGGVRTESVWFNFDKSLQHDYKYIGDNFRERERIKRQQTRWVKRIEVMPERERAAMVDAIVSRFLG